MSGPPSRPWRSGLGAPSRLQFRVHPAGLAVLAGLLLAARVPALSPGNGPGFALVAALAAALVLDGTWSLIVLRRSGLVVAAAAPPDGTVGRPVLLQLDVAGRRAPLLVRVSSVRSATWLRLDAPDAGELTIVPERRGEFSALDVSLLHSAPLGLVGVQRTVLVSLPTPILIGPLPIAPPDLAIPREVTAADSADRPSAGAEPELFRGARPYQPGDDLRRVHWPLTARSGELMVRELDALRRPAVVVVANLGPVPGEPAERAAGLAAGVVEEALARGLPVVLVTRESSGTVTGSVTGPTDAGRRLALAVPGEIGPLPSPGGTTRPLLVVDPHGARWRTAPSTEPAALRVGPTPPLVVPGVPGPEAGPQQPPESTEPALPPRMPAPPAGW